MYFLHDNVHLWENSTFDYKDNHDSWACLRDLYMNEKQIV